MKSKYAVLTSVVLAGLIAMVGFGYMIQQNPKAFLVFAVGSQPDSYGNRINQFYIRQNRGGSFWMSDPVTYSTYESGVTIEIIANYPTWVIVAVDINQTLCPGGILEADDLTRVYISISGVYSNQLMTWIDPTVPYAPYYRVWYNSTVWTPSSGVAYSGTLNYQVYY